MAKRSSKDVDNLQWELPPELPLPSFRARGESSSSSATGVILQEMRNDHRNTEGSREQMAQSSSRDPSAEHLSAEGLDPTHRQQHPGRSHTDTIVENHKYPADMMEQVLGGPLRHLSSAPALLMLSSGLGSKRSPTSTPMEEQRYSGKPDEGPREPSKQAKRFSFVETRRKSSEVIQSEPKAPIIPQDDQFITGVPLTCLVVGLMFAVFLISIDRTIISTVRQIAPPQP